MTDEYDPQAHMQAIQQQVGEWFDAFVGSPEHERLSETEKGNAPGIVQVFSDYSFRYIGKAPEQWNQSVLAECCLEILPRQTSADLTFFQSVAPVLSAFFDFLAERNLLSKANDLSKAAAELDAEIVAASQDKRNWGPSKAFMMAAERAGVDTCDANALRQFMVEYNLRQFARMEAAQEASVPRLPTAAGPVMPVRYSQPRPGRNDPCPCGSGKKFKKCCGA
jgi:uncharacterized protein YchJ